MVRTCSCLTPSMGAISCKSTATIRTVSSSLSAPRFGAAAALGPSDPDPRPPNSSTSLEGGLLSVSSPSRVPLSPSARLAAARVLSPVLVSASCSLCLVGAVVVVVVVGVVSTALASSSSGAFCLPPKSLLARTCSFSAAVELKPGGGKLKKSFDSRPKKASKENSHGTILHLL